jgi:MoxR-like ATPase
MKPSDLAAFLNRLVKDKIKLSTMIWGPPGIGKSSIVQQTAHAHKVGFIDLRLSQLAPTDLRGLPVANKSQGTSHWFPPEFLPTRGRGILFLDEINLAPPTMQGMAQQLILDRRVGSYEVPDGWYIWAAGNRKEDRAIVFDMPAPLANRFIHLEVEADLDSFKNYALMAGIHEQIVAFTAFRPHLLHKMDTSQPAWPSPRSWAMASDLHHAKLEIAPAVGNAAATEFSAFVALYTHLPDFGVILEGKGDTVDFPDEPSVRYALTIGLTARAQDVSHAYHAFKWLTEKAPMEWVQLCAVDLFKLMRTKGKWREFTKRIGQDATMREWLANYRDWFEGDGTSTSTGTGTGTGLDNPQGFRVSVQPKAKIKKR